MTAKLVLIVVVFAVVATACSSVQNTEGENEVVVTTTMLQSTTTTTEKVELPNTVTSLTTTTTTTTTTPIAYVSTDVLVYGESTGAAGAAVSAARRGRQVTMVIQTGYVGGQSSAGAVSTMDEYPLNSVFRESGLYGELYQAMLVEYKDTDMSRCYWSSDSFCPEPVKVRQTFETWLESSGVDILTGYTPVDVLQSGFTVTGLIVQNVDSEELIEITADVVLDGSETGELYPLIEGLEYSVGNGVCVQKTTWNVVMNEYFSGTVPPELRPESNTEVLMRSFYGDETVDGWIKAINKEIKPDGFDVFPGWSEYNKNRSKGLTVEVTRGYRGLADSRELPFGEPRITRTVNNYGFVDSPVSAEAMTEPFGEKFTEEFIMAKDRAYFYLYWAYYVLGIENWGISTDQGYDEYDQMLWSDRIPDRVEQHFAVQPYFREHPRIEGVSRMTWDMIKDRLPGRGIDMFSDSVMIGGYMTDQHGCAGAEKPLEDGEKLSDFFSSYGAFDVDPGIFVPKKIDGFMPAILAGMSMDRLVAGSLRMQPTELIGGQVAGMLAAMASEEATPVRNVDTQKLRQELIDLGVVVDVP